MRGAIFGGLFEKYEFKNDEIIIQSFTASVIVCMNIRSSGDPCALGYPPCAAVLHVDNFNVPQLQRRNALRADSTQHLICF